MKDKRLANLRPWQPGQSGNPGGRPKRKPITEAIEALLDANPDLAQQLAAAAVTRGKKSLGWFTEVRDMLEGKPAQTVSHEGSQENPVSFDLNVRFLQPDSKFTQGVSK